MVFEDTSNPLWERLRSTFLPFLGWAIGKLSDHVPSTVYVTGATGHSQFVGTVPKTERKFEEDLEDLGFESNPLAAWKKLENTNLYEEGSYRYVSDWYTEEGPEDLRDFHERSDVGFAPNFQVHVVVYEVGGGSRDSAKLAIFAHYEPAWDTHPIAHYRGNHVYPYVGVRATRELLRELYGANYNKIVDEREPW